jgi:hypothetical protein
LPPPHSGTGPSRPPPLPRRQTLARGRGPAALTLRLDETACEKRLGGDRFGRHCRPSPWLGLHSDAPDQNIGMRVNWPLGLFGLTRQHTASSILNLLQFIQIHVYTWFWLPCIFVCGLIHLILYLIWLVCVIIIAFEYVLPYIPTPSIPNYKTLDFFYPKFDHSSYSKNLYKYSQI